MNTIAGGKKKKLWKGKNDGWRALNEKGRRKQKEEGRVWWEELEWEGGQGHSISTISTIIPSVPAWAEAGFSNQFHFHSWKWASWATASWVIIVLSPFWLGTELTEVRAKASGARGHGFWLIFCQSCKVFWSLLDWLWVITSSTGFHRVQEDLNNGPQRQCEVFWHGRWTKFWHFLLKPTVQCGTMGCLGLFYGLPTRCAFSL